MGPVGQVALLPPAGEPGPLPLVAQLAVLASYGSAWLSGKGRTPPAIYPLNSTFADTRRLLFADAKGRGGRLDDRDWLAKARKAGVTRLWLDRRPGPGPGAMEDWGLLTTGRGARRWRPVWEPAALTDGVTRYDVTYEVEAAEGDPLVPPLEPAQRLFLDACYDTRDHCRNLGLAAWADWFGRAAELTCGGPGIQARYPDGIEPLSYPVAARQLALGVLQAWTFGPGGDFDALVPQTDPRFPAHQAMRHRLHEAAAAALLAAVNAELLRRI
jgi:hypothetical protein